MSDSSNAFTKLMQVPVDKLAERFVQLRAQKKALEAEHARKLQPFEEAMGLLDRVLLAKLQADGAESMKTPSGTVYVYPQKTATIVDFDALWKFIRDNDKPELLQRRVTISEVEAHNEAYPDTPVPGLQTETIKQARVRAK